MTKKVQCRIIRTEPLGGLSAPASERGGNTNNKPTVSESCVDPSSRADAHNELATIAGDFAGDHDLSEAGPYHPKYRIESGLMLDILA